MVPLGSSSTTSSLILSWPRTTQSLFIFSYFSSLVSIPLNGWYALLAHTDWELWFDNEYWITNHRDVGWICFACNQCSNLVREAIGYRLLKMVGKIYCYLIGNEESYQVYSLSSNPSISISIYPVSLVRNILFKPLCVLFPTNNSHRPRNLKTSTMYSIALAFIIFLATAYHLQVFRYLIW